ncbi:IS66 family insertion sequence element accessory protein TnpA [Pseudoalteromonas sp. B62]|uniref:IS66 family insertion sequence element accessory protein TnpA n=1 Tax=Pseudoalteromonas sp. B62 TaxID=630483 RepID=UPI00301D2247
MKYAQLTHTDTNTHQIDQQQTSDLSIVAFCKENTLPISNFYKYRSKLQDAAKAPKLVKVQSKAIPHKVNASITLSHGETHLTIPTSSEPTWQGKSMKKVYAFNTFSR